MGNKRPGNLGVMNKSQTLPRSMGSKTNNIGVAPRNTPKPAATPPAVRRQFSVITYIYHENTFALSTESV